METLSQALDDESGPVDTDPSASSPDYLVSLRLIWPYLTHQRFKLVAAIGLATLSVVLELVPVYVIYSLAGEVVTHQLTSQHLLVDGLIVIGAVISGYVLLGVAMGMSHLVAFEAIYQLRLHIARHILVCHWAILLTGAAVKLKSW